METDSIQIKHSFSDHELAKMGREQAEKIDRKSTLEVEFNGIKKQYASDIAAADTDIKKISARVYSGWEMRSINCLVLDHRHTGYRLLIRLDNAHIAKRRKLSVDEMQMKINTEKPPALTVIATLHVDAEDWDVDATEVHLTDEEFERFKGLDIISVRPAPLALAEPEPPKPEPEKSPESEECEYCKAGHPFDPKFPDKTHIVPSDNGTKRRTCKAYKPEAAAK